MNHIKQRLSTEVTRVSSPHRLVCEHGILIGYDDGLLATRSRSSLRQQLRLATLVHAHKPKDRLIDSVTYSQKPMVLQQCSLLASDTARNVASLLGSKHDSVEGLVDFVIIVEGTGILSDCVQLAAKGAERSSVNGVGMARCIHIRASLVDGGVLQGKVSANVEPANRRSLIGMLEDSPICFMQEIDRL